MIEYTAFIDEKTQEAISRIKKFLTLASALNFDVCVGFSGGKDSQVVYDLCLKAKIPFKAYFNHCFESATTLNFIRKYYPEIIWRRVIKQGFIENIWKNHDSLLPTVEKAYCCKDYKHNPRFVDNASIVGVRSSESIKRKSRRVLELKNKTILKKHSSLVNEYFKESCQGIGSPGTIQLMPIVDWSENDIWTYLKQNNIPINPDYKYSPRIGCVICPKCNLNRNFKALLDHPKLIDAIIKAREHRPDCNWVITNINKDFSQNKAEYICRWLNYSFRPLTKRQESLMNLVLENYYKNKALQATKI